MLRKLISDIQAASRSLTRPDGDEYLSLAVADVRKIAVDAGASGREVETIALENNIVPERYVRNMKILSTGDQLALLGSTVSVVGLGGLGGTVTEVLARMASGN